LDKLNQQAQAKLNAGDRQQHLKFGTGTAIATDTGFSGRVEALGRVGAIAWNENQKTEVQISLGGKRFSR